MANYTIYDATNSKLNVTSSESNWYQRYKEAFIEQSHDFSQLSLLLPDDCLVMAGPPRRPLWQSSEGKCAVGFVNTLSVTQQSSVQPLKALGSRRHIFAKTNQPAQITMRRAMFTRGTLMYTIYSNIDASAGAVTKKNQSLLAGDISTISGIENGTGYMYTNLEEDLYRIPFGLRIMLASPTILANETAAPSILAEGCTFANHNMTVTAGEAVIFEDVTIYADRIVGWQAGTNLSTEKANKGW